LNEAGFTGSSVSGNNNTNYVTTASHSQHGVRRRRNLKSKRQRMSEWGVKLREETNTTRPFFFVIFFHANSKTKFGRFSLIFNFCDHLFIIYGLN